MWSASFGSRPDINKLKLKRDISGLLKAVEYRKNSKSDYSDALKAAEIRAHAAIALCQLAGDANASDNGLLLKLYEFLHYGEDRFSVGLNGKYAEVRHEAVKGIVRQAGFTAVNFHKLVAALHESLEGESRDEAIAAIAELGDIDFIDDLVAMAPKMGKSRVTLVESLTHLLSRFPEKGYVKLVACLENGGREERLVVADVLDAHGQPPRGAWERFLMAAVKTDADAKNRFDRTLLLEAMKSPMPHLRVYAIRCLGEWSDATLEETLLRGLNDPDDEVRLAAIRALRPYSNQTVTDRLLLILKSPGSKREGVEAAAALGSRHCEAALPILIDKYIDEQMGRLALLEIGTEQAVVPLLMAANFDPDSEKDRYSGGPIAEYRTLFESLSKDAPAFGTLLSLESVLKTKPIKTIDYFSSSKEFNELKGLVFALSCIKDPEAVTALADLLKSACCRTVAFRLMDLGYKPGNQEESAALLIASRLRKIKPDDLKPFGRAAIDALLWILRKKPAEFTSCDCADIAKLLQALQPTPQTTDEACLRLIAFRQYDQIPTLGVAAISPLIEDLPLEYDRTSRIYEQLKKLVVTELSNLPSETLVRLMKLPALYELNTESDLQSFPELIDCSELQEIAGNELQRRN